MFLLFIKPVVGMGKKNHPIPILYAFPGNARFVFFNLTSGYTSHGKNTLISPNILLEG